MKKVGLWLAIAALLVNGPRFILIFLRVDNIDIPLQTEAIMLGATGLATGLVLTGGGAYIAHTLAESKAHGATQFVMIVCWCLLLVFSVILLAPLMVASIRVSPLQSVFTSNISQWAWSITAVAAVEVIAAGAMAAYALEGKSQDQVRENKSSAASILTGALVRRLETQIAPPPSDPSSIGSEASFPTNQPASNGKTVTQPALASVQPQDQIGAVDGALNGDQPSAATASRMAKHERQRLLLDLLRPLGNEAEIRAEALADHLSVSRQSIYRDLRELKQRNLLTVDDDGSLDCPVRTKLNTTVCASVDRRNCGFGHGS